MMLTDINSSQILIYADYFWNGKTHDSIFPTLRGLSNDTCYQQGMIHFLYSFGVLAKIILIP